MFKNSSAKCYQDNKERLQKMSRERYHSLSKEQKEKQKQSGHERYKNLSEDENQKIIEYGKNCYKMRKSALL